MALLKKKAINLHEVDQNIINRLKKLPSNHILTFDDGLFSQYAFLDDLLELPHKKIFYISSGIINTGDKFSSNIDCATAHEIFFKNPDVGQQYYMNWAQILEISKEENCFIGMHGHNHLNPNNYRSLKEALPVYKNDVSMMLGTFHKFFPNNEAFKYFQFPYNIECDIYESVLKLQLQEYNCNQPRIFRNRIDFNRTEF